MVVFQLTAIEKVDSLIMSHTGHLLTNPRNLSLTNPFFEYRDGISYFYCELRLLFISKSGKTKFKKIKKLTGVPHANTSPQGRGTIQ